VARAGGAVNNGEAAPDDLVAMTSIDASTMSRLVTRMVRQGLVTRTPLQDLQPRGLVALSAKGRREVREPDPIAKKLEVTAVERLPPRDLAVVKRALAAHVCQPTNGRASRAE